MKKIILLSLIASLSSLSLAQTFFDGFESYKADSTEAFTKGEWMTQQFWPEPHPAPRVRGTTRGVTPYEGSKMLEMRSVSNTDLAAIISPASPFLQGPSVEYSVNLLVASSDFVGQQFGLRLPFFEGTTNGVRLNFTQQTCTTNGAGGDVTQFVSLPLDNWIQYKFRVDFEVSKISHFVNGIRVDARDLDPITVGREVGPVAFGSRVVTDLTNQYPLNVGAPGVFVDSFKIQVVPECLSWISLSIAVSIRPLLRRFKRK